MIVRQRNKNASRSWLKYSESAPIMCRGGSNLCFIYTLTIGLRFLAYKIGVELSVSIILA